jgi:hypothetical protein
MNQPSTIAHYRIVSTLGEDGMGAVYRATDTKLNRGVVPGWRGSTAASMLRHIVSARASDI